MMQHRFDEIKRLVAQRGDVKTFYDELLRHVAEMTGAQAGLVWSCSAPPYRLICERGLQALPALRAAIQQREHVALLDNALRQDQPMLVPPRHDAPQALPVVALGPIARDEGREMLELFLSPHESPEQYRQWLECLHEVCQAARVWSGAPAGIAAAAPRALSAETIDAFAEHAHRDLQLRPTADRVANEARRALAADRVSVALWSRRRGRIVAISGQPSVNRRSATVQALERVVNRVLPLRQEFWYPPEEGTTLPPEIERPLNDYLTLSTTRSLVIVPILRRGEPPDVELRRPPADDKCLGGLVLEQFDARWSRPEMSPVLHQLTRHAGSALRNAVEHRALWLYPVWRAIGQTRIVAAARNLRRSTVIAAAVLAAAAALIFIPAPFRVVCDGVVLPKVRYNVFAQVDGLVEEVHVQHGERVAVAEPVVRLSNNELQVQLQQVDGQIAKLREQLATLNTALLDPGGDPNDPGRRDNESSEWQRNSLTAELESLQYERTIIEEQLRRLVIVSPGAGEVLTWDVEQQLRDKPVRRGDLLLEVADVEGAWELELQMPDRRVGHLLRAQAESGAALPVTFRLAADPNVQFSGRIAGVAHATDVDPQQGQTIRVEVDIDQSRLDIRQVRSGVMARIECGRRPLGFVWLHDIFEFLQAKVFFRLW